MLITEEKLLSLGFIKKQLDDSPYEVFSRDDIALWDYNGEYWVVDALDQAGIHVEFRNIAHLAMFFDSCDRALYP